MQSTLLSLLKTNKIGNEWMDDWVYHEWHKLLLGPLEQHFRYGTIPVKPFACDFETFVGSQPLLAISIIPGPANSFQNC